MSTSLCTGFVKCVVTQYLSNEWPLDLSKAFNLADHNLLFRRLLDRSLPLPIVHLLMTWYRDQNMRVRSVESNSLRLFLCHQWCASRERSLSNFVHNLFRWALDPVKAAWCWLPLEASLCGGNVLCRWSGSSCSFSSWSQIDTTSLQTVCWLSWFEV